MAVVQGFNVQAAITHCSLHSVSQSPMVFADAGCLTHRQPDLPDKEY